MHRLCCFALISALTMAIGVPAARAGDTGILLPLGRSGYQTNEWIDLAVTRTGKGPVVLTVTGDDGSELRFQFADRREGKETSRRTEFLHVNGWLLRPGHYRLVAAVGDDRSDPVEIDVFSHVRKSDFKLISWGRARGKDQLSQGEDSLGFNVSYAAYSRDDSDGFLRAGMDYFGNCVMSGGHQMDLRLECDWSDPYVTRGGTQRVVRQAMLDRTRPNTLGVHFYDEPGLTWHKHPKTGEFTPHDVPAQVRSHVAAFGRPPLPYHEVDPKNQEHAARWRHWALWKLGFMDAAWKEAQFGVSMVRPDFLSLTQSIYGWSAPTDGYYFNVARSLPITSGHGGYDDVGCGYFFPSFVLEMARARDHWKPCWYLPTWYGNTKADAFRMEQYLSFQTNVQGLMTPPDIDPFQPEKIPAASAVVESNRLMGRLGPIFSVLPVAKPPAAMLYSLSNFIHRQTGDRKVNYFHETSHWQALMLTYLAGKLTQQPVHPLVEEDVLDGSLAANHKVLILADLDYIDPKVMAAIDEFVAGGGVILTLGKAKLNIKGAVDLGINPQMPEQKIIDQLMAEKKYDKLGPYTTVGKHLEAAAPLAKVLGPALVKAGVLPVFETDLPTLSASRQGDGDIEYLFAVNATWDDIKKERNGVKAAAATISFRDDGRPVYDAIFGGKAGFQAKDGQLTERFRFGPGQMRVFVRTARPIGKIQALPVRVASDLVLEKEPVRVEIGAALLDDKGSVLAGAVPVHIRLVDPLGVTRHELVRATRRGTLNLTLPLAANDPAGEWTLHVRELLGNTEDKVKFGYRPSRSRALAGASHRAIYFGNELDNVFRFARLYRDVTIVKGKSPFNEAAAQRLQTILRPWGVNCKVMDLAEATKPRTVSEEEAKTWIGLYPGAVKPGAGNAPLQVGFAAQGPVILLGNPADHPIIKFLDEQKFLPYKIEPNYVPGDRGLVAWQRDGVGKGQESIALISFNEEGMNEAVGTFYEAVAGFDPLTKWVLPEQATSTPARSAPTLKPAAVAWSVTLPDSVVAMKADGASLTVLTHDGSLTTVQDGKIAKTTEVQDETATAKTLGSSTSASAVPAAKAQARPDRIMKLAAQGKDRLAVAYWGGTLRIVDDKGAVQSEQLLPQDVTALTWLGDRVVAGLADGRVMALTPKSSH